MPWLIFLRFWTLINLFWNPKNVKLLFFMFFTGFYIFVMLFIKCFEAC
jgi:hypothetical protein